MKNSFFAAVRHSVLLCISASYRRQAELKYGEILWDELNDELPEATGVTENDIPRLQKFYHIVSAYPPEKWLSLRKWLLQKYDDMEQLRSELMTGMEVEVLSRHLQILSEHLDAMVNGAPRQRKV